MRRCVYCLSGFYQTDMCDRFRSQYCICLLRAVLINKSAVLPTWSRSFLCYLNELNRELSKGGPPTTVRGCASLSLVTLGAVRDRLEVRDIVLFSKQKEKTAEKETALSSDSSHTAQDEMVARSENNNTASRDGAEVINSRCSKNPFVTDMTVTFGANVADGGCSACSWSPTNPFITSMELTQAANGAAAPMLPPRLDTGCLLTPPPSGSINPFTQAAVQQSGGLGESAAPAGVNHTPATPLLPTVFHHITDQIINSFAQMNSDCFATSTPVSRAQAPFHLQTVSQITSGVPSHVTPSHAVQGQTYDHMTPRTGPPPPPPRHSGPIDSSDDEFYYGQRERIRTLRPSQFDWTGAWKDFIYQFESCAEASRWTEKTMAVQLRFSLTGAAGAIVHKSPRSARWSYQRIVEEIEAALLQLLA